MPRLSRYEGAEELLVVGFVSRFRPPEARDDLGELFFRVVPHCVEELRLHTVGGSWVPRLVRVTKGASVVVPKE